eukprot:6191174-Pleurochrysis_carterae.AAC.1
MEAEERGGHTSAQAPSRCVMPSQSSLIPEIRPRPRHSYGILGRTLHHHRSADYRIIQLFFALAIARPQGFRH